MTNQSKKDQESGPGVAHVDALVTRALSVVAERTLRNNMELDATLAARLRDAAASESVDSVPNLVAEMLAIGVSPEAIATLYIPHAARQMGEDWCDDTLSFARVTIGTARLQSSLRSLGTEWAAHGYDDDNDGKGGVVVIVAKDAFHTLGALVLCGQLRRMGFSVRLALGATMQDLRALFQMTSFDVALISASSAESIESLRTCVNVIRHSADVCPPIIIGGNVLDQDVDIKALTGADYTTRDPFEALEYCGLTKAVQTDTPSDERRS